MLLAIDVGLSNVGCAKFDTDGQLVKCAGFCTTAASGKLAKRMAKVDDRVRRMSLIQKWLSPWMDDKTILGCALEMPSGGSKSSSAAYVMGLASGAIVTMLLDRNLPFECYLPGRCQSALMGTAASRSGKPVDIKQMILAAVVSAYPKFDTLIGSCSAAARQAAADAVQCGHACIHGSFGDLWSLVNTLNSRR